MMLIQKVTTQLLMKTALDTKDSGDNKTKNKLRDHGYGRAKADGGSRTREDGGTRTREDGGTRTREDGCTRTREDGGTRTREDGGNMTRDNGVRTSFRRQRGVRARRGESIKKARPGHSYLATDSSSDRDSDESGYRSGQ